ncbi:MAG TPA: membrane protein insertase YidC, partial [Candidatus Goldiibacteriota bacterium]|nr:membrane protein insertase YidC [Candidatus Goldiibacteriota bacterium]
MNDKNSRLIIFIVLSGIILFGYNMFFMPKPAAQQAQETAASAPAAQASQNAAAANSAAPAAAVKTSMPSAVIKPFEEKKYVIENSLARVSFSDRGAVAVGYELKKFTAGKDNKEVLELIPNKASYSYLALNQAA